MSDDKHTRTVHLWWWSWVVVPLDRTVDFPSTGKLRKDVGNSIGLANFHLVEERGRVFGGFEHGTALFRLTDTFAHTHTHPPQTQLRADVSWSLSHVLCNTRPSCRSVFVAGGAPSLDSRGLAFNRSHKPGDLMKISQDRMKVNALVSSPGSQDIPQSSAMAWFFRDSLDRESIRDPFLLQVNEKTCEYRISRANGCCLLYSRSARCSV